MITPTPNRPEGQEAAVKPLPKEKPVTTEFDKAVDSAINEAGIVSVTALQVNLCENFVEIIEKNKKINRVISYESFKAMIDRSLNTTETVLDIRGTLLPSNVFFMSQSKNRMYLNCYYPGGNRKMLYMDGSMEIAAPNIVISHVLQLDGADWIVSSSKFMCTDLPISKLPKNFIEVHDNKLGLYLLPMSNTYAEGNMCYGGNHMPARFKDNNLRGLDWYYRFLWETPFNNDLGIKAIGDSHGVKDWYKVLEKEAKDNKPFPYKMLRGYRDLGVAQTPIAA